MMMFKYGVTKTDVGLVTTLFFITYGIGQFVNAFLSRKINIKIILPCSLILSSLFNVAMLFIPVGSFSFIKYMWCINGFLLSLMWPCIIRVVSESISEKYKNCSVVLFGTVTAVGVCITYGLSSLFKAINHFEIIYIFSASVGIICSIIWMLSFKKMTLKQESNEDKKKENVKGNENIDSSLFIVPTVSFIIVVGFISIVSAFGKEGMQTWFPIILEEKFNMNESFSTLLTIFFPFASILGTFITVYLNKKIKNYFLLSGLFILISILSLLLAWIFNFNEIATLIISTVILSVCCASITNITTSIIPLRMKNAKNSGFYAGIFNGCLYIGTSIVTYALGAIAENKSWNFAFITIIVVLAVGLVVSFIYYVMQNILKRRA